PRSEHVDELEHVVRQFAGAVGCGQALDQPQPAVAVLEAEELLVVDRARMSSARSVCLRAVGFKTTSTRDIPWPKSNIAHLEQLGTEVDGDARLPVVALRVEHLPLIGVERSAHAQRHDSLPFEVARDGVRHGNAGWTPTSAR